MIRRAPPCRRLRAGSTQGIALAVMMGCGAWVGLDAAGPGTENGSSNSMFVYFGTYTGERSKGIYAATFDPGSGALSAPRLAVEVESPAFLALHPNGRHVYAVNEVGSFQGRPGGAVSAFALNPESGELTLLGQQSSGGGGPCHLTVDSSGRAVLVANYGGGSIAALPIRADGGIGPLTGFVQHAGSSVNPQRQTAPHAHGIHTDPANRFVLVPDLGLDKVLVYRWDPQTPAMAPHEPPAIALAPGAGPRHLAFHPGGRFVYVINELLNTITAFGYDARTGSADEIQTIGTLPEGFTGQNTTAEIAVHPSGRFLYGSNRGHDSLVVYVIDPDNGRLDLAGHVHTQGRAPRNFAIDPSGHWILAANQNSDNVVVLSVDSTTGMPHATGRSVEVPAPVCILFR